MIGNIRWMVLGVVLYEWLKKKNLIKKLDFENKDLTDVASQTLLAPTTVFVPTKVTEEIEKAANG